MLSKFGVEVAHCRRWMIMGGWDMVLFFPGAASPSQLPDTCVCPFGSAISIIQPKILKNHERDISPNQNMDSELD